MSSGVASKLSRKWISLGNLLELNSKILPKPKSRSETRIFPETFRFRVQKVTRSHLLKMVSKPEKFPKNSTTQGNSANFTWNVQRHDVREFEFQPKINLTVKILEFTKTFWISIQNCCYTEKSVEKLDLKQKSAVWSSICWSAESAFELAWKSFPFRSQIVANWRQTELVVQFLWFLFRAVKQLSKLQGKTSNYSQIFLPFG